MKKRLLALLLLVSLLGTVLSGCGDGSAEQAPEDGQTSGSTDAGTQENAITVGIAQDLDDSLDPHKAVAAGTKEVMFNVFEGLMKPTSEGDLTPAIAESYEVSPDRLTYTFTLREGVKFHNGDTVTAEDVVYSINRCAEASETGVLQVEAFSVIQSVEAADDRTVVITIAEPSNEFISYMTTAVLPADYDQQDTAPVGTGPFKFVSRSAQDSIVMEKFYEYWGTPAQLDKVTFKIIENADSILMSLQSGAVDLFAHLTSTQVAQLGGDFNVVESTMNLVQAMYLNNKVAPFDNEKVRQALCLSLIHIYGGYHLQVVETPGHTPGHMCLYDAAKKLLLCGDHILGTITPNICIELSTDNPLQEYLDSLKKVEKLDVQLLLSSHGTPVEDMYARIRELYRHHRDRLAEVMQILGNDWKHAYTVARDMTWEIDCKNWDEFPAPQKWFATGEAISHLQYLYAAGKVSREERNGVYHYKALETV